MCDHATMRGRQAGKKNAPSFIYEILHGEPRFLPGRTDAHPQKTWKGISVDEHIPTRALDELDRIEALELRASCEGSGPERPTFLIVRFKGAEDLNRLAHFVAGINAVGGLKCGAERGAMGLYRIGITAPLWYEKDRCEFEQWWLELPVKIHCVLAVIQVLAEMLPDAAGPSPL